MRGNRKIMTPLRHRKQSVYNRRKVFNDKCLRCLKKIWGLVLYFKENLLKRGLISLEICAVHGKLNFMLW